jgi:integrase
LILGRGTAQTDEAIVAEYHGFLEENCQARAPTSLRWMRGAPWVMRRHLGKPIIEWTEREIVDLCEARTGAVRYFYTGFMAFLFLRGYYRPSFDMLQTFFVKFVQRYKTTFKPYRQQFERARDKLGYRSCSVSKELTLLVWLLTTAGKPLDELTRADFDAFQDEYQAWYLQSQRSKRGDPNPHVAQLERYLVCLGIIPEAKFVPRHEERFAQLRHEPIRQALRTFLEWREAKCPDSTPAARDSLLRFFLWLQEHYPETSRLAGVSRTIALAYAGELRGQGETGTCSLRYQRRLYRDVRLFFDFVIEEQLDTSPNRNPFTAGDLPVETDSLPRYVPDHELHDVLEYCNNGATLRERTFVITLLHTGIRASELIALQVGDVVQIQGLWKLHVREGKGLKDRLIPLTAQCLAVLQDWQEEGWERANDFLFTYLGQPLKDRAQVSRTVRELGRKAGVEGLSPHRLRHTFAVALLNYGIRESALQKLMGHESLRMTLKYARVLDRTVEQEFNQAVERMQTGSLGWVPGFFAPEDYGILAEAESLNWIRLPHGYCRRHHKLHCESDVKCLLCDRFCALPGDLPRLQEMHDRFLRLGMDLKANVVGSRIRFLESESAPDTEATLRCFQSLDERCLLDDMASAIY